MPISFLESAMSDTNEQNNNNNDTNTTNNDTQTTETKPTETLSDSLVSRMELVEPLYTAGGAVLIEGPKWCGKTTTALQQAGSVLRVDNPESKEQNLQLAKLNPLRSAAPDRRRTRRP